MWAIVLIGVALFFLAYAVVAGGGAWSSEDEAEQLWIAQPKPYMSPAGYHRHRCSRCETVWEHPNNCAGDPDAHRCPECGHEDYGDLGWPRYTGPLPPDTRTP